MKKNRLMRIAALLLVLTLATSCFVGGTFAKYVSTTTATDSARVAKWEFTSSADGDTNIVAGTEKKFTFDLFNTINDTKGGAQETNMASKNSDTVIAPGTTGTVSVTLTNKSEVDAEYKYSFAYTAAGVPLEWSTTGAADSWKTDITTLDVDDFTAINMNGTAVITLYWRWAFHVDATADGADTDLGLAGTAQPSVTVTVNVQQVD